MSNKTYTLQNFVDDLRNLSGDTLLSGSEVNFGRIFVSGATSYGENPDELFDVIRLEQVGNETIRVQDILSKLEAAVKTNPSAPVFYYNRQVFSTERITGIMSVATHISEPFAMAKFRRVNEALEILKNVSGKSFTELADVLGKLSPPFPHASFTQIGVKWYLYDPTMFKDPDREVVSVQSNCIDILFHKRTIGRWTFYVCKISGEEYDKLFPKVAKIPTAESIQALLGTVPLIDENGIMTTIHSTSSYKRITRRRADGQKHGKEESYYLSNGQLESYHTWENGLRNGPFAFYSENGKLLLEGTYVNDKHDGVRCKYHKNGNREWSFTYAKDILSGPYTEWDEAGNVIDEGEYVDGVKKEKVQLVATKIPSRFTVVSNDRVFVVEKAAGRTILIGSFPVGDSSNIDIEKPPKPTTEDCTAAKALGFSYLSDY